MTAEQDLNRVFFLSPANLSGRRARALLNPEARFELAVRLRTHGAPLGQVFSFISGLYFRGKLAYAQAFSKASSAVDARSIFIITATRGLLQPSTLIGLEELREMATGQICPSDPRYRLPLERDANQLAECITDLHQIVLLGSVATPKYLEPLSSIFGRRLVVPAEFVGLGDMSRGSMLLRAVRNAEPLSYIEARSQTLHPHPNGDRQPARLADNLTCEPETCSAKVPAEKRGSFELMEIV